MLRLKIVPAEGKFRLESVESWRKDSIKNLAGSLATDGTNLYWADTTANLYGVDLQTGQKPGGWNASSIYLPPLVAENDKAQAFVNTKPAIGQGTVYVTMRNYSEDGWSGAMDDETSPIYPGYAGAIVAINASTGTPKWESGHRLQTIPGSRFQSVANTDPLVMESAGLVMVGDINGYLQAFSVSDGTPTTMAIDQATCKSQTYYSILQDGEKPAWAQPYYTSAFGTSTNPMAASPLIVVGANIDKDGAAVHRLLGLQLQSVYNLKWSGDGTANEPRPHSSETLFLSEKPVEINHEVLLEVPDNPFTGKNPPLQQVLPSGAKVSWFAVESQQWYNWVSQKTVPAEITGVYLDETPLPGDLKGASGNPGTGSPVGLQATARPGMPNDGYIVGVIDVERLAAYGADHYGEMAARLLALKEAAVGTTPVSCTAALAERVSAKDSSGDFVSTHADNFLNSHYIISPDASVSLAVPGDGRITGTINATVKVQVTVTNHSTMEIPGALTLKVKWPGKEYVTTDLKAVTAVPGNPQTIPLSFTIKDEDALVLVRAEFNMETPRAVEESDYTNNIAQVSLRTDPYLSPTAESGGGRVIIVPSDCIPETDPSTGRLCKNYDKTLNDW
ncbi:MAG: hypothetical protein ACOY94_18530 [Bacillota bacterium]